MIESLGPRIGNLKAPKNRVYTRVHNVWSGSKSVVAFGLIKISTLPCYPRHTLNDFHGNEEKKIEKKVQNGRLKN
jgi:hypothetical protein